MTRNPAPGLGVILGWLRGAPQRVGALPLWAAALPLVVLLGATLVIWLRTPIVAVDTDLWYHLADGRAIAASREIPSITDFSFLAPDRPMVDYFWLFQVLVYGVHALADYLGLVVLRAGLFAAALGLIAYGLISRPRSRVNWFAVAAVTACYVQVLASRSLNLRPHMVSYLVLTAFVVVLVKSPRNTVFLPVLAVLWMNSHGITYPVLLLVCGALLANYMAERFGESPQESVAPRYGHLAAVLASAVAVLATPHGKELLPVPFISTAFAQDYIAELRPFDWHAALSVSLAPPVLSDGLGLLLIVSLAVVGLSRRPRLAIEAPGALVLAIGGVVLVTRGARFSVELVVLLLPLVREALPVLSQWAPRTVAAGSTLVVCLGIWSTHLAAGTGRASYPLWQLNLPLGTTELLVNDPLPGRVMNHPNVGGYLRWRLPAHLTFAMDMRVPHAFRDEDMFVAAGFFADETIFQSVLARHRPTYLLVPNEHPVVDAWTQRGATSYRVVMFDDTSVLYADREQRPTLRALRWIDPYGLHHGSIPELSPEVETAWLDELRYALSFQPSMVGANQALAILANRGGRWSEAEQAARRVITTQPALADGWLQLGDALGSMGNLRAALDAYRQAARVASDTMTLRVAGRSAGLTLMRLDRPREAYRQLRLALPLFEPPAPIADIALLAHAAVAGGDPRVGRQLAEFALLKTPVEDRETRARLEKLLEVAQ